ncbi:MAG: hypothetical protein ACRDRK_12790 [Pseudonocardia sp.]
MDAPSETGHNHTDPIATAVIAFVAEQVGGPERLLAIHVADERARCRGCTTPGTGTPQARWPCVVHFYASQAANVRAEPVTDTSQRRSRRGRLAHDEGYDNDCSGSSTVIESVKLETDKGGVEVLVSYSHTRAPR